MKILPSSSNSARRATWLLCLLVWSQPILVGYLITIINKVTRIPFDVFYDYIVPAIYVVLVLSALPYIRTKLKIGDWIFYFGFLAVYFGSYLFVPSNEEYLSTLVVTIPFVMLPMFFLGVSFEYEPLKKQLYVISVVSIIVQVLFFRLVSTNQVASYAEISEADHFMHLAYQVLPYVLYVIWYTFEKPDFKNILFSVVGGLLIILLGTRGPFAAMAFFLVTYIILFKYSHIGGFYNFLIFLLGISIYFSFTMLISEMMDSLSSLGGSTRILGWLLGVDEGSQISSDARVNFAELTFTALKESGYMGLGFAGDRIFMGGFYVHNFFLECLASFGIFFGVLIPVVVFYRLIKGVLRDRNSEKSQFLLLLISLGMIPLLVSGSYVEEPWFYLMLGYCTQTLRAPKSVRGTI